MASTLDHQKLVHDILSKVGSLPNIRLWKNATGIGRSIDNNRIISFGLKGSADLLGILAPSGRLLAIEVKTGKAIQTKQQRAFQAMVEKMGGIYILARSINDVFTILS